MKKRILSLLLTACMLLSLLPGVASAAGDTPVASVTIDSNTTEYDNFTDALTAAKAAVGSTLTLLANVLLPDGSLNNQTYDMSGTYTLDLDTFTLDVGQGEYNVRLIPKFTSGTVTITGTTGSIVGKTNSLPLLSVSGGGTLNLTGGTLCTESMKPAVSVGGQGTLNVSGSATVKDACSYSSLNSEGAISSQGNVNISGGTVSSEKGRAINNQSQGSGAIGSLTISGGTISSNAGKANTGSSSSHSNYCTVDNSGKLNITGGTITSQNNHAVSIYTSAGPVYLSNAPTLQGGMGEIYLSSYVNPTGHIYAADTGNTSPYTGAALRVTAISVGGTYGFQVNDKIVRTVTTGDGGNADKFTLTNPGYLFALSDTDLILAKAPPQAKWGTNKDDLTKSGLFSEALTAKPAYIQLQENVSLTEEARMDFNTTLDLNSHDLIQTSTDNNVIYVVSGKAVTLCDATAQTENSVYTSGKVTGGNVGVNVAYGSFIMESGTISGNTVGISTGTQLVTLKGGCVTGNTTADIKTESVITLAGALANTIPASIKFTDGTAGDTVLKSDGTYSITNADLAKFTSADSAFTLALEGTDTAAVIKLVAPLVADSDAKWGTDDSYAVGSGTFANALTYANGLASGTAYIQLQKNITLTETAQFTSSITLDLNGHDITQTTKTLPVLAVGTGGAVVLCDSTASTTNNVYTAGTITGGLIGVSIVGGSFELHSGKISGNGADTKDVNSGGVLVGEGNNSFTMSGGEISGNMGDYGAGVNVDGSFENQGGSFTMSGGTIKNNTALRGGGGISVGNDTTFTMNDGTIDHNSATAGNGGGGINSANGTVVLKKGTVTGNTVGAENSGATGGIYCYNGASLTLSGDVTVTGNTFDGKAADIAIAKNGNAAIILTSEMKNTAATAIQLRSGEAGDTLVKSDGTYTITTSDLAKFTSADSDFTFALDGAGTSTVIKLASASVADAEAEWTVGSETKTGTFADALTAMKTSGGSIKLLSDVSTADSTFLPAKTVSLDLNGKIWSSGREVRVVSGGTLNLSGTSGGIILNAGEPVTVQSGGTLNLSGGTVENSKDIGYSALSNSGTVVMTGGKIVRSGHDIAAVNNEGTFTITGGEITNDTGDGIYNDEMLTMSGGIITAKKYGIKNRKTLTMTGGSITADGDGVYNSSMSKSATITGGTIKSLKEYGINNWSNAKLYLGGTASVTATVKSAVYNGTTLYLFGTPTLTKGSNYNAHQIYDDSSGKIVANNGKTGGELAYYAGGTLDISFPGSIAAGTVLVSGIENTKHAEKFNITIGSDTLTPTYDDTTKEITAKGKEYTITYKDRAKADDGAAFSGTHGADYPTSYTAGATTTLVAPTKTNYTFGGWYRDPWGSTNEEVTELSSSDFGNETFYAKWTPDNKTEKTATPDLENTIAAASSGGYAEFNLKVGAEYQEQVEYKLYTAATGNAVPDDITAEDYYGDKIELYPVTVSTDYWLSATEDGKLESDRVKISVRPRYSGLDTEGYLTITTPQELANYLNYCEPDSAVVNGTTVTQSKDVHSLYDIYFAGSFEGVWDLGGKAVRLSGNTTIYLLTPDAENVKLTVKNGTISGNESAISIEAGTVTLESVALNAYELPIDCYNGTLTMTDVTATVKAIEGAEDELGTQSIALYTTPLANITIHSGKLVNEYEGGKTYFGSASMGEPGKKLSSCIPATSTSVPADSVSLEDDGDTYEFCTQTVTVTKNGGQPVPTYTVTYDGNGNTAGAVPTDGASYKAGVKVTVLDNTGTLTKTGHIFAGWNTKSDGSGTDYAAGASLTITGNTTLYAKWTPVFDVGGSVTDDTNVAVANATVKLMLGKDQIGTDKNTDAQGKFTFTEVPTGVYNLVITHGIQIVTRIISVTANTTVDTVKLPKGTTNSVVEVKDDTPVVVGGLDEQFTPEEKTFAETANNSVTIKLTVEKKAEHSAANADEIKLAVPDTKKLDAYLDLSVLKTTVTNNIPDGGEVMAQTLTLLEIRVPLTADQLGKTGYAVYRYHVDKVDTLTNTHNADGEYIEVVAGMLILHVKKFSTYAIAFDKTVAPTPPTGGSGVTTYAITAASGDGGAISPKGTVYVNRNGSKTFTITPNEGYEIADVLADGVSVGRASTYTFEKVTAKHTIEASFRRTVKNPFTDVTEDDWFYSAVTDLYEKGLMTGTAADSFSPLMNTDRATIVTVLWRMEGMPSIGESSAFPDVPADAWYAQAVAWGHKSGIVKGYDTGKFGPADPITREQLAAILWRYAGSPAVLDYEGTGRFTDTEAISPWAAKAVTWAISEGLLTGKGNGILDPIGHAARAEAAAMLARFLKSSDN